MTFQLLLIKIEGNVDPILQKQKKNQTKKTKKKNTKLYFLHFNQFRTKNFDNLERFIHQKKKKIKNDEK